MTENGEKAKCVSAICEILKQRPEVRRTALFGSFARDEQTQTSDIDLLVQLDSSQDVSLLYVAGLQDELQKRINRSVDIVTSLRGYPTVFIDNIMRDGEVIYER